MIVLCQFVFAHPTSPFALSDFVFVTYMLSAVLQEVCSRDPRMTAQMTVNAAS